MIDRPYYITGTILQTMQRGNKKEKLLT